LIESLDRHEQASLERLLIITALLYVLLGGERGVGNLVVLLGTAIAILHGRVLAQTQARRANVGGEVRSRELELLHGIKRGRWQVRRGTSWTTRVVISTIRLLWRRRLALFNCLLAISVLLLLVNEPIVAALILDVEVTVLNDDKIHVLENANRHEDPRVAHHLPNQAVLARRGRESIQD